MPDQDSAVPSSRGPTLLVGIGASAGGLQACKQLLGDIPADTGMAFVVILHLDPDRASHLAELLQASTAIPVVQIDENVRVEPDHVYVIAPNTALTLKGDMLMSGAPGEVHGARKPIDTFFASLAADQRARAAAVVLSGNGSDGALGIQDVRQAGGLCLVQEPDSAQYDGMPRSAIATAAAHHVASPSELAAILIEHARDNTVTLVRSELDEASSPAFDAILDELGNRYGVDFQAYKRGTIERRAQRRMDLAQQPDWPHYLDYVRAHPDEFVALYEDLLIGVTCFFREPDVWAYLEQQVLPELLEQHDPATPLRIWVAGCATGEEAYSVAIVMTEQLERAGLACGLQIYATDVDTDALGTARRGLYPRTIESQVSPERLLRFFKQQGEQYQVEASVRESVTFATHNLLADPPFSRLDLVSCRNVLIYLRPDVQQTVLQCFHFALRPSGVLMLGSSETLGRRAELFETVSKRWRIYHSVPRARAGKAQAAAEQTAAFHPKLPFVAARKVGDIARLVEQAVLARHTAACVAVTESLSIVYFFGPTQDYLTQPSGEARLDLLSWARPSLYPRLRAALAEAVETRCSVTASDMTLERDGSVRRVECCVEPLSAGLLLVSFRDVPPQPRDTPAAASVVDQPLPRQLDDELERTQQELRSTVEELNRTSEEYRISHEEMLSLNEELQSSNEELETSKEELQSLNDEVNAINRELEHKNTELKAVNTDLNNLLVSTAVPTIFLDRDFCIKFFTPAATELMRLVPPDVGRKFAHVKERFRDERLFAEAQGVLDSGRPIAAEISSEDGHWYVRRIVPYRTEDNRIDGVCITWADVSEQKRAASEAHEARVFSEAIVRTIRTPLLVLDAESNVVAANDSFYQAFKTSPEQTLGRSFFVLDERQWDIRQFRELLQEVLPASKEVRNYAVEHTFPRLGWRYMRLNARVMERDGRPAMVLVSIEDLTDWKKVEVALEERSEALNQEHARKDQFLAMLGHELRNPMAALANGLELLGVTAEAERAEEIRQMMLRQTGRISAMLDQLLDVARVVSGKIDLEQQSVDLGYVARTALEAVRPMMEMRGQQLVTALPAETDLRVWGDSIRLIQVVENLLVNASKYTDPGGKIELSIESKGDAFEIAVRDTGVGIDAELLPHVFELFTQAHASLDRRQGGLGLGLALASNLVALHGGGIAAASDGPGCGSQFVVTLPRLRGPLQPAPEPARRSSFPPLRKRRVLIADDEADIATSLGHLLTSAGHETRTAFDGPAALEAFRLFSPDVVLLDIGLPGMDGYELARRMRADGAKREVLILAVTGYRRDRAKLEVAGFDHHIIKPVDFEKLRLLIGDWQDGASARH